MSTGEPLSSIKEGRGKEPVREERGSAGRSYRRSGPVPVTFSPGTPMRYTPGGSWEGKKQLGGLSCLGYTDTVMGGIV